MAEPEKKQKQVESHSLATYLNPEVSPEDIEVLDIAKSCGGLFPLFKELVKNHIDEFWIKLSVLLLFAHDQHKTSWTPQELGTELIWLQEGVRKRVITQLSRSGWLCFNNGYYYLSPFGRNVLTMLTALVHQEEKPDALGANISSLTLLELYQNDPTNTLRMFLNELICIEEEIQKGLESKSEYLIRKLNKRIRSQFTIAIKSREHLENLPADEFRAYRLKQQIHEHLSNFHARLSQVQRIQNDLIARRIMLADKSLSQHDVNAFLINSDVKKLAELGRSYTSFPVKVCDMVPALMVYETEWQMEKDRSTEKKRSWSPMENATEGDETLINESRFFHFVAEVEHTLQHRQEFTIENFVPHENWTTSSFRFTMLSVLEGGELPTHLQKANEQPVPQLAISQKDGIEIASELLNDYLSGIKEITKGVVRKANVSITRD